MFKGLELVDEASLNGTDTPHTWLLVPLHPGGRWAKRNLAGKGPRPYVGATYASMYLRQQLQSFLPGDALQFHTVWPSPVQDVIDELVQGGPMGYFFRFLMLLKKLPCLEELDGMLRPCRSLGLDGKDQRHLFRHGSGCLYGQGCLYLHISMVPELVALGKAQRPRQHPCRQPQGAR